MQEQEDTSTFSEENLISVTVNGHLYEQRVPVRMLLSDFLRHELHLTGTHVGCEHGVCGCCTVLLNGEAVRSCLMLAVQADGMMLTTIEGMVGPTANCKRFSRPLKKNTTCNSGHGPPVSSGRLTH